MAAVILQEPRYSVLNIFEDERQYAHRQPYARGITCPLEVPLGILPPFQFVKLDGSDIASIELLRYVRDSDDVLVADVLTSMNSTGLEKTAYNGTGYYGTYDVWSYPGTVPLPVPGIGEGAHYLRFSDQNGNWLLSELFVFHDGLELRNDYVRLEWWALQPIILDRELVGGVVKSTCHIQFVAPFKWWCYVKADLIGSDWKYEKDVIKRDDYPFQLKVTMYGEWEFRFPATEAVTNAIARIPLHDRVQVTYNGKTYNRIFDFMPAPKKAGGGLFDVLCIFRTGMATHSVSAPGLETTAYEVAPGGCLPGAQFCKAIVEEGTVEYNGGYVTDEFGSNRNFLNGDFVIVEVSGFLVVRQAIGTNTGDYGSVTEADYSNWWTNLDGRTSPLGTAGEFYFFALGGILYDAPYRAAETIVGQVWTATGHSFGNSLVTVVLKDGSGNEWTGATINSADFPTTGISFEVVENGQLATAYKFRASTWKCPNIAESEWYELSGVEYDEIGDTLEVHPDDGGSAPGPDDEGG